MKKLIFSMCLSFVAVATFAQTPVGGTVVDAELDSPLPGATVVVQGSSSGVSTDFNGNFTINSDKLFNSGAEALLPLNSVFVLKKES